MLKGESMVRYIYWHPGEIVTLGRTDAVGILFNIRFRGWPARLMKKIIHLWYLNSIGGLGFMIEKM